MDGRSFPRVQRGYFMEDSPFGLLVLWMDNNAMAKVLAGLLAKEFLFKGYILLIFRHGISIYFVFQIMVC